MIQCLKSNFWYFYRGSDVSVDKALKYQIRRVENNTELPSDHECR